MRFKTTSILLVFHSVIFSGFHFFTFMNFGVTPVELTLLFNYIYILKYLIWENPEIKIQKSSTLNVLVFFSVAMLLSGFYPILNPTDKSAFQFLKSFLHLYYLVFFVIAVLIIPISSTLWRKVLRFWLLFSILINLYAMYQLLARAFDLPGAWIELGMVVSADRAAQDNVQTSAIVLQFENFYRATSIFSEPSSLGLYNIITFIFAAIPLITGRGRILKNNALNITIIILSLIGLFLTFSLIGVMSLFLIIFSTLLIEKKKNWKFFIYTLVIGSVSIGIADRLIDHFLDISVIGLFYERVDGILSSLASGREQFISGESYVDRVRTSMEGFRLWTMNYLTGVGLGNTYLRSNDVVFVDSGLFAILGETGIIGAISFVMVFLVAFLSSLKLNKEINNNDTDILVNIAVYLSLIIAFINIVTSNQYIGPNMWFYLAFIYSVVQIRKAERGEEHYNIRFFESALKDKFNKNINSGLSSN